MQILSLNIVNKPVLIHCQAVRPYDLLVLLYGSMQASSSHSLSLDNALNYFVDYNETSHTFHIQCPDQKHFSCEDEGDFLFQFEQHLVVALQLAQPRYLFLHSAILAFQDKGIALIAPSGSGKSTTTWGLLHEGFDYLTDEMSAIDIDTLNILAFSHAISLKKQPPAPYPLPKNSLKTSRAYNVPVTQLPKPLYQAPLSLSVILYVKYDAAISIPEIHPVSRAESCTQIYTNSLNPLSHPNDGLDAAMKLAQNTRAYTLKTGDLQNSCRHIKNFLEELFSAKN